MGLGGRRKTGSDFLFDNDLAEQKGADQTAYGTYDAMTVEAIRALSLKIENLQQENNQLKVQVQGIADLKTQKEKMEKRLERLEALLDSTANETDE